MKKIISGFKNIFTLLDGFSEEEINALLNNKARLNIVYYETTKEHNIKKEVTHINKDFDIESVYLNLEKFLSREDAVNYLNDIKLNKSLLREIAKHYNISITTRDTNIKLINKIVEGVIGAKIKYDALLNTNI